MSSPGYVDPTAGAVEHCESMALVHPDLAETYYKPMASLVQQKLWHQLTLLMLQFVQDTTTLRRTTAEGVHLYLALYDRVVLCVDSKLNPLHLARIAAFVAHALALEDPTAAQALLENLLEKETLGTAPRIYVQSKAGLLQQPSASTSAAMLERIRTNAKKLAELAMDGSDLAMVHAAHHEFAMWYYKTMGPPEAFYESSLSFLSYAPVPTSATVASVEYRQLATDLCLAALTGEGVYNLQQVLDQTVLLQSLREDPTNAWLVQLVEAVASGDVSLFQQLTTQYASAIQTQPALVHRARQVQEKLAMLALVRAAFAKPAQERALTFTEISESLQVPVDNVEMLVMRALSVGLIKGYMDQVDGILQVDWVMPRTLNTVQLQELATRYGEWATKVGTVYQTMHEHTPTALA